MQLLPLLLTLLLACTLRAQASFLNKVFSKKRVRVVNTDAPILTYPGEHLPEGNRTIFSMQYTSYGGLQVVALGAAGQLWHTYQLVHRDPVTNKVGLKWADWDKLTMYCPSKQVPKRLCNFDGDPVVGRNLDGRLEVFARFHDNLDVWQMYQLDPNDPTKWSVPRESSCVDQVQSTGIWYCLADGPPTEQTNKHYWINTNPVFPTSDLTVLNHPKDGRLQLWYRNFEGHMYMVQQTVPGDPTAYDPPQLVGGILME